METCENCERKIGNMETPMVLGDSIVCAECFDRLKPAEKTPKPAPWMPTEIEESPEELMLRFQREERERLTRTSGRRQMPDEDIKALGLTSRGQAMAVMVVGLFLAPAIAGIPLLVWGALADHQMKQEMLRRGIKLPGRSAAEKVFWLIFVGVIIGGIVLLLARQP